LNLNQLAGAGAGAVSTALTGGRASLIGTLLGSLLIAMINNGLNLLNVSVLYQQVTIGLLLLVTLAIGVERKYRIAGLLRRAG